MSEQQPSLNITARRTVWTEARARNAAKRVWLIASVGVFALTTTVLVLVMLPREVNRVLNVRIDALPKLSDTVSLEARVDSARMLQQRADSSLQALRTADADRVAVAAQKDEPALGVPGISPATTTSEARRDLGLRVARARSAPLVDSYRGVGEAELLRSDARARALLDSLNDVDKNREAYAALGGADARYAALTARITSIGQRLVAIADQHLTNATLSQTVTLPPRTVPTPPVATAADAGGAEKSLARDSTTLPSDTAALAPQVRFNADSVADRLAKATLDSTALQLTNASQALERARQANADIIRRRDATRAAFSVVIPPGAMLLAALAIGLAIGYGVAFAVELRQPRIADVAEVERVTGVRVIVHTGTVRALRQRRSSDNSTPAVIDSSSDSYQLLHVTLTGFGDTTRVVRVMSDSALLTATVGINLAAAAAREARAALLVDADSQSHLANSLLGITNASGIVEAMSVPSTLPSHIVRVAVGRDQYLKALFQGGSKSRKNEKHTATAHDDAARLTEFEQQFRELAKEADLTVVLVSNEADKARPWLPPSDVILCARLGSTRLNWLMRSVLHLRASGIRLRAVLVWAADAPKAR